MARRNWTLIVHCRIMPNNTRIAKNTIYLYLRTSITILVALYTSRIVLNALGVEDYGIWSVLGGVISMFGFINQSLSSSIFRYITYAIGTKDKELLNRTYSISIIIHVALSITVFILCETIGQWFLQEKLVIPEAKRTIANIVFNIVVISSSISILSVPYNSVIIAFERMSIFAYLSISDAVLKLLTAAVVYYVPSNKLVWYAVMLLFVSIIMLLFYYLYVRIQFKELKFRFSKDNKLFKSLLAFSGWSFCGNIATIGYNQGLSILLNMFFGPAINAARGISLQIEQTVRTFVVNFQSAINPQIIKYHAQKETMQMHLLMYRSSKFSLFLLAIFALPIMLETSTILNIWLGQVPDHTISFIRIMFIVIALETMSNSIMTGVVANGNIKNYQLVVSLILLSIIPISYISLRIGAVAETVFIVYLIVEIFAVAARLFFAQKMLFLDIKRFIYDVILRSIVVIVVGSIIPISLHIIMPEGYIRFMVVVISGFITSLYAIYKLGLNNHEQTMVKEAIRKKLQR